MDGRSVRPDTYKATVVEVVDGDTMWVEIDHGFFMASTRKLRLRGIDAPELWTKAGGVAKAFVREVMDSVEFVVVYARSSDKYGRFLSDVYYGVGEEDARVVAREGRYLNGELVVEGFAVGV